MRGQTKMIPYKIIRSNQTMALEILIEVELEQGHYQCQGGVTAYWDPIINQPQFMQALSLRQQPRQDPMFE